MYRQSRRGTVLPLLAICLVALLGFVALSIDVGLMAIARTQCQNAADCAALTGARTLSGNASANDNFANCEPNTRAAVSANSCLGVPIAGSNTTNVVVSIGAYSYNPTTSLFAIAIPKAATDPYDLVQVSVNVPTNATYFGRIFNVSSFAMNATATAAHRPRDVSLAVDMTGSMRFASCLGIPGYGMNTGVGYSTARNNGGATASGSNNPESIYPTFGHYSSATAALQFTSSVTIGGDLYSPGNITEADASDQTRPAIVLDFYQNTPYTTPMVPAFNNTVNGNGPNPPTDSSLDSNNCATGDKPLHISNVSTNGFATTVKDVTGSTTKNTAFETNGTTGGYDKYYASASPVATFKGYTQGPRYWGKTFFTWPPDSRWGGGTQAADPTKLSLTNPELDIYNNYICDWRRRFFGTNDNTKLWDSSGNWKTPTAGGYTINYNAILAWLATSPNPFPPMLVAGHIEYYSLIPTTINTSTFPPTDNNQRFWKEYIDHCLGLYQSDASTWQVVTQYVGYGDDFAWGTVQISAPPSTPSGSVPYMNYTDNPRRPRTHFWFGPMTMVDFIGNFNMDRWWMPGDCHESPLYACKLGIQAALTDAQNNHPNDYMSLITFSFPMASAGDTTDIAGPCRFNAVRVPLGTNYSLMQSSLWFPPETLNADGSDNQTVISPYSAANSDVPRASGTTCYSMPLMLAFNQFQNTASADTTLRKWITPSASVPEGVAGGEGRKGAQKMVIFCTDGIPNTHATATLNTSGSPQYYPIRYNAANQSGSQYPAVSYTYDNDPNVLSEVYGLCTQLSTTYATPRKPFRLYAIGFGPVFDTSNPNQSACLQTLQSMQYYSGTQASASTSLPAFQIVTGTPTQMSASLQTAIQTIMQASIQVVLLQ